MAVRAAGRGLPARYAKMGFKKGWKAFRAASIYEGGRHVVTRKSRSKKEEKMVRRRRRAPARRSYAAPRRSYRRRSGAKNIWNSIIGMVIAVIAAPLIPAGILGRAAVAYFTYKKGGVLGAVGVGLVLTIVMSVLSGGIGGLNLSSLLSQVQGGSTTAGGANNLW